MFRRRGEAEDSFADSRRVVKKAKYAPALVNFLSRESFFLWLR